MPAGPAEHLVTALIDAAADDEPPALAALQPMYRAVYVPDARLGLAFGVPEEDWRGGREARPPDWKPEEWNSVEPCFGILLLNGAAVWQARIASVDWGAGISGYLPWPNARYADDRELGRRPTLVGWRTTSWEASFARLLTQIAGHDEFRSRTEEVAAGMLIGRRHPLDA